MTNEKNERLVTRLAETAGEIQAAQRLRYRVFADEMGARLESASEGLDRDEFDPYCKHLILCDGTDGRIVGTYRILTATRAQAVGRFYSAGEFEIEPLRALPNLVEIGRSCIDPAYRTGAALAALLAGLARHLRAEGHEHVIGCASMDGRAQSGAAPESMRAPAPRGGAGTKHAASARCRHSALRSDAAP